MFTGGCLLWTDPSSSCGRRAQPVTTLKQAQNLLVCNQYFIAFKIAWSGLFNIRFNPKLSDLFATYLGWTSGVYIMWKLLQYFFTSTQHSRHTCVPAVDIARKHFRNHTFFPLFLPGMRNAGVKKEEGGESGEGEGQLHMFSLAQACTYMQLFSSVLVCVSSKPQKLHKNSDKLYILH